MRDKVLARRTRFGPWLPCLLAAAWLGCADDGAPSGSGDTPSGAPSEARGRPELTGAVWQLVRIEPDGGDPTLPDPSALPPSLRLTGQETDQETLRFTGSGGCNRFFGGYVAGDDGSFSIDGPPAATRSTCPPTVMQVEAALFQALEAARSYEVDGDQLVIAFDGGTLRFAERKRR